MGAVTAFEKLGLKSTAAVGEIKAKWKVLASEYHPDHGGDAAIFSELRRAYNEALRIASAPRKCSACNGTGKHTESHGFHSIKIPCHFCGGRGKQL